MLVEPVSVRDPDIATLVDLLTAELAGAGYPPDQMFGYSLDQLERRRVHLVGAKVDGVVIGIGGLELQAADVAELKRFYVRPEHRGSGAADAIMATLTEYAQVNGVRTMRLETGTEQVAAMRFYRRHGFVEVPRFPPYVDSASSVCMQRLLTSAGSTPDGSNQARPHSTLSP